MIKHKEDVQGLIDSFKPPPLHPAMQPLEYLYHLLLFSNKFFFGIFTPTIIVTDNKLYSREFKESNLNRTKEHIKDNWRVFNN